MSASAWLPLIAEVLDLPAEHLAARVRTESFVALGGTSLRAIALVSLGQRRLARDVDLAEVLAPRPLAAALATASSYVDTAPPVEPVHRPARRDLLPGQKAMLAAHLNGIDQPYRLMFTVESPHPLDPARTRAALGALVTRHASLRTRFVRDGQSAARVVLPAPYEPTLLHQTLPAGADAVRTVHDLYGARAGELLRPFDAPPVVFVLTSAGATSLLTVLVHHVLVDGWSIGVLCREFAELYGGEVPESAAPAPDWVSTRLAAAETSGALAAAGRRLAARLDGAPVVATLPTDLPPLAEQDGHGARLGFHLDQPATDAATELARRCGTTVTTVVLAAWALALARRSGQDDLVLGVPAAGRPEDGMAGIVGLCTRVVPVRCRVTGSAGRFVAATATALAEAVADADLPFERAVDALDIDLDPGHNPLAQLGFAAHHELVPDSFTTSGDTWRVHEGHCAGAVFDALLYLQSWSERPRLALEYATSVLTAADAGELAESLQAVLVELAAGADLTAVTGLTASQRDRLRMLGAGGDFTTTEDVWSRFEQHALSTPDAPAVTDQETALTYRELHGLALAQAALLHERGVRPGDRVLLELPRSAAEAVAVLGVLRLGAAYVAVDESATPEWKAHLVAATAPRARIGYGPQWTNVVDCPVAESGAAAALPPATPDPDRAAYVSFTSGSTGVPKGVVVGNRAVLRLAADPVLFAAGDMCMMRLAPLAFDASTLELLVPLAKGAAVAVHPPGEPTPDGLTAFLRTARVSHAWLTSGLFHLVADHRPDAFHGLRQVFTGGGVVSPPHMRKVLEHCPDLRVTNGYGPTENTTFTTTSHVDGAERVLDPLPIGTPVHGSTLYVVDPSGRLVPPGAVGELWTGGAGLADGYLADPERTAASFVSHEGGRVYRTGDLVRWGADGQLRFLGRNDRQVKIAGHRVELVDIERRIRARDGVADAVVFLAGETLCAAVKAETPITALRQAVEPELAAYARPQRWFAVAEFPLDRNGKVDLRALATVSAGAAEAAAPTAPTDLADLVADAWAEALGTDDFDVDEPFFEVGGDSLSLAVVRRLLQSRLSGRQIPLTDLYRFPTVRTFSAHLEKTA